MESCLYYCKDTLFEAIHNAFLLPIVLEVVVCITAKIHFLKQFTTIPRYSGLKTSCLYYCKDTLFEAIHNVLLGVKFFAIVVCITAKIHFLKQFTTLAVIVASSSCCLYYCKDTLFEAIHNVHLLHLLCKLLFVLLQRYTF